MTRACRWCGRRFRDGGGGARFFWCETLTNFDWPDRAGGSNGSLVLEVDKSTLVQHILSRTFFCNTERRLRLYSIALDIAFSLVRKVGNLDRMNPPNAAQC